MKRNVWEYAACMLLMLVLVASFAGCASASYRSDVTAQDVMAEITAQLSETQDEYYTASSDTYALYFGEDAAFDIVADCCIVYHSESTNVDQIGVFRVKDTQSVEGVRRMVQEYADGQCDYLHGFASNYNQEELDKIQNQQVECIGQYVIFTILTPADEAAVTDAVTACLAK